MQTDVRVHGVKQLGVLLLPLDGMLIHCRSSQRITSGLPNSSSVPILIFMGWKSCFLCQENCLAHECHISKTRVLCGEQQATLSTTINCIEVFSFVFIWCDFKLSVGLLHTTLHLQDEGLQDQQLILYHWTHSLEVLLHPHGQLVFHWWQIHSSTCSALPAQISNFSLSYTQKISHLQATMYNFVYYIKQKRPLLTRKVNFIYCESFC